MEGGVRVFYVGGGGLLQKRGLELAGLEDEALIPQPLASRKFHQLSQYPVDMLWTGFLFISWD